MGTPQWDQDVEIAALDPIKGENIAYTLHFYASSHQEQYRQKAQIALDKGIALFVTEWGTCMADGNGEINYKESDLWLQFMKKNSLSWCTWSICDKDETSAIYRKTPDFNCGIQNSDLSASGLFIRKVLTGSTT